MINIPVYRSNTTTDLVFNETSTPKQPPHFYLPSFISAQSFFKLAVSTFLSLLIDPAFLVAINDLFILPFD